MGIYQGTFQQGQPSSSVTLPTASLANSMGVVELLVKGITHNSRRKVYCVSSASNTFIHTCLGIHSDHKPLLGLIGEHKSTSPQTSTKICHWSLYLSYFLKFHNTALDDTTPELVLLADHIADTPVTADHIHP